MALSQEQQNFILEHIHEFTDKQMAEVLSCGVETIRYYRRKLGFKKPGSKRKDIAYMKVNSYEEEKVENEFETWKKRLRISERGKKIRQMMSKDEWFFFEDEWAAFHVQFEDLTHSEETTIEHIIFLRLRILENQKEVHKTKDAKVVLQVGNSMGISADHDDYIKLQHLDSYLNDLNKEYRELLDRIDKLFKSLNATREQREQQGKVTRETFWSLVQEFKQKEVRRKQGKMAELLKLATEKNKDKLRQAIEFADGEIAPQLLDYETVEQMKRDNVKLLDKGTNQDEQKSE